MQTFETLHLRPRQNTKTGSVAMEVIIIVVLYKTTYIERAIEKDYEQKERKHKG